MRSHLAILIGAAVLLLGEGPVRAWDYAVHRLVNELALVSLPTNFPAFVQAPKNRERIAFLSGEADRWRNTPDLTLKHVNGPDHYLDVEDLADYEIEPGQLPELRYDFIALLAAKRARNPEPWEHLNGDNNKDHTKQLCGLLPWAITEYYGRLKSGFSYLKAYEQGGGTPEEIANARENIVYVMGVMGHFVADAAQPLHTTKHFNGWVGDNPEGYTTSRGFHAWIDGGFWGKIGVPTAEELKGQMPQAGPVSMAGQEIPPDQMFRAIVAFILDQQKRVEPLYALDKAGGLTPGSGTEEQGRAFLQAQVIAGAWMLGDLWVSAWEQAPEDTYLKRELAQRAALH